MTNDRKFIKELRLKDTGACAIAVIMLSSTVFTSVPATASGITSKKDKQSLRLAKKTKTVKTTDKKSEESKEAKGKKSKKSATPAKQATSSSEAKESKSSDWRAKPPTFPAPRPFTLPEVETYKMDNGLEVQLVEDNRFPYVTAFLGLKRGSLQEPEGKLGLADITADQINEGTESMTSKQIAAEGDFIGGGVSAGSDYDFTIVRGSCLSNYTPRLFTLMEDILLHPSFPESELKLKKTNWIQELKMKRSQPHFLLEEQFRKVVFGSHPYSVVAPTAEMISKLKREDLVAYHKATYVPDDAVLLVIDDFESDEMKAQIKDTFEDWKASEPTVKKVPAGKLHKGKKIYLVDRPGSVQSSIKVGNLGIKKTDPDYFAMQMMNQILGGSAHSRLFLNIREQKGYTYGAYSSMHARVYPGAFEASADVRTEVTGPSVKEFLFELDRMRDEQVTAEELDDAKNYMVGQFQLGLETQSGLAQRLLEVALYDLPKDYLETYADNVMKVSVQDVQQAAKKAIKEKDLVITVVGDAKKIKEDLRTYAPIEIYDMGGEQTSLETGKKEGPDS